MVGTYIVPERTCSSFFLTEENGFNPVWNEGCEFELLNPDLALLRFCVQDEDVFGDPNFIGQAVFPFNCVKGGYSSVPLKNLTNEELELCSLLVHVEMRKTYEENEAIYTTARWAAIRNMWHVSTTYNIRLALLLYYLYNASTTCDMTIYYL